MELDKFFYEIFKAGAENVSVKTRIGKEDPEEMYELMKIYNKYPLKELVSVKFLHTFYFKIYLYIKVSEVFLYKKTTTP